MSIANSRWAEAPNLAIDYWLLAIRISPSRRVFVLIRFRPRGRGALSPFPSRDGASGLALVAVEDRVNRCRAIPRRGIVSNKREFEPATAEQSSRLEGGGKGESATRNSHASGRPIGAGAAKLGLKSFHDLEHVVCVIRDDTERISRLNHAEVELGLSGMPRYKGFPIGDHGCAFVLLFTAKPRNSQRQKVFELSSASLSLFSMSWW